MSRSRAPSKGDGRFDAQITAALERISVALRILLWDVAKEERLSPIQIQFLIFLASQGAENRTVSGLAREFGLTQATVSDAVRVLVERGLVKKSRHVEDRRVWVLGVTPAGRRRAARLSRWAHRLEKELAQFSEERKKTIALFLMDFVRSLRAAGVIRVVRMCLICAHFRRDAYPESRVPHLCELTGDRMRVEDLRVNCLSHLAMDVR